MERLLASTMGLGPLEPLMEDPDVDEIMVNGHSVGAGRARRAASSRRSASFESEEALLHVIERILSPLGRRVDEAAPLADARLPDGSRVNCVIPPLSLDGPLLTIRRFRRRAFSPDELVANGTLSEDALRLPARERAASRRNVVVSGGTGSGKTTLLNVLSSFIGAGERVITIEDAAELRLQQPHVLRLESRPANLEGGGEVTIRQLVRNALRMRPDRIIVGEVRGAEALDMLQALNTRTRRLDDDRPRELRGRRAAPHRDARADGRRRAAARRGATAGRERDRPRRPSRARPRRERAPWWRSSRS